MKEKKEILNREHSSVKLTGGFTLVETLLAIVLITSAILAPLSIGSSSLRAATTGKDRLVAIGLARDGVEFVRSYRDTNRLRQVAWLSGLEECMSPKFCAVDSSNAVNKILIDETAPLKYHPNLGLYGYTSGWANSKFRRSVIIQEITLDQEVLIRVLVEWDTTFNTKRVEISDHLTNWSIK